MSAGHRHNYLHHPDTVAEIERLLEIPHVQSYLGRPFRTIRDLHIPLTGGSNLDGSVYYLDPSVPEKYAPFVLWHERVEKALRAVFRMHYNRAHTLATAAERISVETAGLDWNQYKHDLASVVRTNEHVPGHMPPDFDYGPYQESGMTRLLR